MEERLEITFSGPARRLDAALADLVKGHGLTRSALRRLMDDGRVIFEGRQAKASEPVRAGQRATLLLPPPHPDPLHPAPADLPVPVLFEDPYCLVVAKPAGMVAHPAKGHWEGTLVNALLGLGRPLAGGHNEGRPGILHRLDKETSGLVLVAKSDAAHSLLAAQFAARTVSKTYVAVVWGHLEGVATVEAPIGRDPKNRKKMAVVVSGRASRTDFSVLALAPRICLVEAKPRTGRTHQIRIHLAHLKHPVVGDTLYGGHPERGLSRPVQSFVEALGRFLLHASRLEFTSPSGERVAVECPPPPEFAQTMEVFNRHG